MAKTAGQKLADAVGDAFGIDPTFIFYAEIEPLEARIVRGIRDSQGRCAIMVDEDGEVDAARVLEVFDMDRRA